MSKKSDRAKLVIDIKLQNPAKIQPGETCNFYSRFLLNQDAGTAKLYRRSSKKVKYLGIDKTDPSYAWIQNGSDREKVQKFQLLGIESAPTEPTPKRVA